MNWKAGANVRQIMTRKQIEEKLQLNYSFIRFFKKHFLKKKAKNLVKISNFILYTYYYYGKSIHFVGQG